MKPSLKPKPITNQFPKPITNNSNNYTSLLTFIKLFTKILTDFFKTHGIKICFSCPYTSPQNGKTERTIRTINNTFLTSLIQASLPPKFWVEALLSSVHTFNLLPSTTIQYKTPFEVLFGFSLPTLIYVSLVVYAILTLHHFSSQARCAILCLRLSWSQYRSSWVSLFRSCRTQVFRIGKRELKYQLKFSESEIAYSPNRRTLLFRIGKLCFPNRKTSL
ncbi:hypothetical protein OSB04_006616 [Centaurea solstitialis]|uniref:Integrase catalytic domain-containing protein n=1 Tax=Centaurea solstitialis TaxID=347529 RepID=A0AA38WSS7_9ASTR|nr:hypothetical protein OSB04_006616 [Centaurea solstitialis]